MGLLAAAVAKAQQPDTVTRRDSLSRPDTLAQDSLLRRELQRIRGEARPVPLADSASSDTSSTPADLLSNLNIIGDVISDLTPDGSTLESGRRFELRELHLATRASIESWLRGDFRLGVDDEGRLMLMEAALTTTSLPWGMEVRAGRFQAPVGEQNSTHRVYLPTIDYPYAIQRFLGPHGGRATGLSVAHVASWLGIRSHVVLTALESFPEGHAIGGEHAGQGHLTFEPRPADPPNKTLQGLGYTGRIGTTWHYDQPFSIETSVSVGSGRSTQPFGCEAFGHYEACPAGRGETGVNARQSLVGAGLTVRWQPRSSGGSRSVIVQSELMRQQNSLPRLPRGAPPTATYLGPTADPAGAYALARVQLWRRVYVAARYDWVESVVPGEQNTVAKSAYLQVVPSELSKFTLMFERAQFGLGEPQNRVLVQMTAGIGARRSHDH